MYYILGLRHMNPNKGGVEKAQIKQKKLKDFEVFCSAAVGDG